jgi:hypothetical protein
MRSMASGQESQSDSAFASPLRVDLMDAVCRKHLRDYLQAHLTSYHEDERGQPAYPPNERLVPAAAVKATTACVRRPARGLVTLRSASGDTTERGMKALLEISAEGDLTICGGANFDEQLLKVAVCKISVHFYEEPARKDMFLLSVPNQQAADAPSVCCCVRDGSTWLAIFRRRGVTVSRAADAQTNPCNT